MDLFNEAKKRFQTVHAILSYPEIFAHDYIKQLSTATEEAYALMDAGLCANAAIDHNCIDHRNFIRSVMETLKMLEAGVGERENHQAVFAEYAVRVNLILERISTVLGSRTGSRVWYGIPL